MRTLIIGLDAFDPEIFEHLADQGKLPVLSRYVHKGGYARFTVSNPPQSEVSWTSIATGLNPGGHGIFDFVHRDPSTYKPFVSLLPTKKGLAGAQFIPPSTATTIFDQTVRKGYPATSLWWPATFPARPESPVSTLPGLGTPDVLGRLGVGILFTSDSGLLDERRKTAIEQLRPNGRDCYGGVLKGPSRKKGANQQQSHIEFLLEINDDDSTRLKIESQSIDLIEGDWSPVIEISFKMGLLQKVHAITRVILTQIHPEPRLFFLPLQIHPLLSPWHYATPKGFVKRIWNECGPFLSLGWPQDTTALEEGCITDQQFLNLCEWILNVREQILIHHLRGFREGMLAAVFDTLDRIQHMFWRDRKDIIEEWYIKLDALVGRIEDELARKQPGSTHIVIVSDHGFKDFNYKVHLNRWLIEHGYLTPLNRDASSDLNGIDWSKSQAYALGLNSIYFNLSGREGNGTVDIHEVESHTNRLKNELHKWKGPGKDQIVQNAYSRSEALEGSLTPYGPDILVGYSPGYRASQLTGLGAWRQDSVEQNTAHWGADHCFDPQAVPGVIFSNRNLQDYPHPSYKDFPLITIGEALDSSDSSPPPTLGDEDHEVIEDRLKSLGYL